MYITCYTGDRKAEKWTGSCGETVHKWATVECSYNL